MVMQFRRGPKASLEVAVSWAVAAPAAHFGRHVDCSVGRMSYATDGDAVAVADVVVASGKDVEVVEALVGDYIVHMAAAVADTTDGMSEVACSIARLTGRGQEISVRQDSCHSPIVAAHIVRAAEGQVSEVDRQNIRYGILQVVRKSSVFVAMPDCGHFEAYDVCFVDLRRAMEAEEDRLIHMVVTSLLLYFPRPVSEVWVEVCWCLASQQASFHLDVVWGAVVVA